MKKPLTARVDSAIWLSIFIGMAAFGLGLSLQRGEAATLGWVAVVLGVAAVIAGLVLIWVRSRMSDTVEPER